MAPTSCPGPRSAIMCARSMRPLQQLPRQDNRRHRHSPSGAAHYQHPPPQTPISLIKFRYAALRLYGPYGCAALFETGPYGTPTGEVEP